MVTNPTTREVNVSAREDTRRTLEKSREREKASSEKANSEAAALDKLFEDANISEASKPNAFQKFCSKISENWESYRTTREARKAMTPEELIADKERVRNEKLMARRQADVDRSATKKGQAFNTARNFSGYVFKGILWNGALKGTWNGLVSGVKGAKASISEQYNEYNNELNLRKAMDKLEMAKTPKAKQKAFSKVFALYNSDRAYTDSTNEQLLKYQEPLSKYQAMIDSVNGSIGKDYVDLKNAGVAASPVSKDIIETIGDSHSNDIAKQDDVSARSFFDKSELPETAKLIAEAQVPDVNATLEYYADFDSGKYYGMCKTPDESFVTETDVMDVYNTLLDPDTQTRLVAAWDDRNSFMKNVVDYCSRKMTLVENFSYQTRGFEKTPDWTYDSSVYSDGKNVYHFKTDVTSESDKSFGNIVAFDRRSLSEYCDSISYFDKLKEDTAGNDKFVLKEGFIDRETAYKEYPDLFASVDIPESNYSVDEVKDEVKDISGKTIIENEDLKQRMAAFEQLKAIVNKAEATINDAALSPEDKVKQLDSILPEDLSGTFKKIYANGPAVVSDIEHAEGTIEQSVEDMSEDLTLSDVEGAIDSEELVSDAAVTDRRATAAMDMISDIDDDDNYDDDFDDIDP